MRRLRRQSPGNFNPRSREGSDRQPCDKITVYAISIHAPAKGATRHNKACDCYFPISIHAPAKGATACVFCVSRFLHISIHAPAKGATDQLIYVDQILSISIHAPAKGATRQDSALHPDSYISIHAPAKGATSINGFINVLCVLFQSTLPRRERLEQPPPCLLIISIHAPAKGATSTSTTVYCSFSFQSTLPRRERQHLLTSFRLQYGYFYFISPIKYSSCFKKIN